MGPKGNVVNKKTDGCWLSCVVASTSSAKSTNDCLYPDNWSGNIPEQFDDCVRVMWGIFKYVCLLLPHRLQKDIIVAFRFLRGFLKPGVWVWRKIIIRATGWSLTFFSFAGIFGCNHISRMDSGKASSMNKTKCILQWDCCMPVSPDFPRIRSTTPKTTKKNVPFVSF